MLRKLGTSLLAVILLLSYSTSARAATRSEVWETRATLALNQYFMTRTYSSMAQGYALGASAYLNGWSSPVTLDLLDSLRSTKNSDGTYGTGSAWDAFQDGTVNPATTGYAVTIAGHVGLPLLDGYINGVVPKTEVQSLVNLLLGFPRVPVSRGACIAYSNSGFDNVHCVHNVNAGVAYFLAEANRAGIEATGLQSFITQISIQEAYSYHDSARSWPYMDAQTTNQDADHGSYSIESFYGLMYWVSRDAAYLVMTTSTTKPIAHTRLTSLPTGPGSKSGNTTIWCELGDNFSTEQDTYLATVTGSSAAQFAYHAAKNAVTCI